MAVVCAGPKAILDVPATLEYLETRGVPVVAVGQAELPGFYARSAGIAAPASVAGRRGGRRPWSRPPRSRARWRRSSSACRCPEADALPDDVARATRSSGRSPRPRHAGIAGPALTPWLLARIASLTDGASVRANTALIVNDARVAGELAGPTRRRRLGGTPSVAGVVRRLAALGPLATLPDPTPARSAPEEAPTACGSTRAARARTSRRSSLDRRVPRSARDADILLLEAPDGFIVQGSSSSGASSGTWSDTSARQTKETLTFLDDDIARFMEEARRPRGGPAPDHQAGHYETAFRVIGRYMDDQKPRDVFFFEQDGAFVLRLLMSGQAGARHELAEFTRDDIDEHGRARPSLRHADPARRHPSRAPDLIASTHRHRTGGRP